VLETVHREETPRDGAADLLARVQAATEVPHRPRPPRRRVAVAFEPPRELRCGDCGRTYSLSARRARDVAAGRSVPGCGACRAVDLVADPGELERRWLEELPRDRREALLDLVGALR